MIANFSLKKSQAVSFKCWTKKVIKLEFYTQGVVFQKWKQNKDFFRNTKAEKNYRQKTRTMEKKIWKESFWKQEIVPDGNMNPHKGRNSSGNGNYLGNYIRILNIIIISLKDHWLFKK